MILVITANAFIRSICSQAVALLQTDRPCPKPTRDSLSSTHKYRLAIIILVPRKDISQKIEIVSMAMLKSMTNTFAVENIAKDV